SPIAGHWGVLTVIARPGGKPNFAGESVMGCAGVAAGGGRSEADIGSGAGGNVGGDGGVVAVSAGGSLGRAAGAVAIVGAGNLASGVAADLGRGAGAAVGAGGNL